MMIEAKSFDILIALLYELSCARSNKRLVSMQNQLGEFTFHIHFPVAFFQTVVDAVCRVVCRHNKTSHSVVNCREKVASIIFVCCSKCATVDSEKKVCAEKWKKN